MNFNEEFLPQDGSQMDGGEGLMMKSTVICLYGHFFGSFSIFVFQKDDPGGDDGKSLLHQVLRFAGHIPPLAAARRTPSVCAHSPPTLH